MSPPPQTPREELANSLSHGFGLLAAIAATPVLIVGAVWRGGPGVIVGTSIFAAAMVLLYLASTLYHAAPAGNAKDVLRKLDHSAIYLLIAGTYTPFTLGVLGGAWGWTLFGIVWGLALVGVSLKLVCGTGHRVLSTLIYVAMGWLVLVAIRPVWMSLPTGGVLWLLVGGLAYTAGVAFYAAPRLRYAHFVWHLFVMAGSTCHFFAVLWYAA
jgi:hemolysin III